MPNIFDQFDAPTATVAPEAKNPFDAFDGNVDEIARSLRDLYLRSILTPAPAAVADAPQLPRNIFDSIPTTSNVSDGRQVAGNVFDVAAGNSDGQPQRTTGLSVGELQRVLSSFGLAHKVPVGPFVKSIQQENARRIALDQPLAAVDGHGNIIQEPPLNNPEANQAEFAKLWQTPTDVTRAALTDAVTTALLPVTYPLYGVQGVAGMQANLPTALSNAFRDTETNPNPEPLPVDVENAEMSRQHPVLATVSKIGQGVAGSVPMAVAGGAPAWAQKLLALGFSAQMIANAGSAGWTLGTELGKNPEDRDYDTITSAVSDLVQDFGFAPFIGLHGTRDIIERYADKPMYVIRKLSDQRQNAPILPPVTASDLDEDSDPEANASEGSASESTEKPISSPALEPHYVLSSNGMGGLDHQTTQTGINNYLRRQNNVPPIQIVNDPTWTHNGYGVRGTVQDGNIIVNRAFVDSNDTLQQVLREEHNHALLSSEEGRAFIRYAGGYNLGDFQYSTLAKQYPRQLGESVTDWKARLTDEFIAKAANKNIPIWQQIVERVKGWLARKGIGRLTDEETGRAIMRALKSGETASEFAPQLLDSNDAVWGRDEEPDFGDSAEEKGQFISRYNLTSKRLPGTSAAKVPRPTKGGVYALTDERSNVMRAGRSKDLKSRKGNYDRHPDYEDFDFRTVYQTDNYAEQRGLEHMIFEQFDPPLNVNKPIGPKNRKYTKYMNAAYKYFKNQK